MSAVDLAAAAASAEALRDCGADASSVAASIDTVAGIRQFEISVPGAVAPLGRSTNYPRSVANRLGASPRRAILEVAGGQGPQHLVTELAGAIAHGQCDVALIFGSEAISTVRQFAQDPDRPDFSEEVDGDLEDRGFGLEGLIDPVLTAHGLYGAPEQYALFENARRVASRQTRQEYSQRMGEMFAPFSKVASENPHAAAPTPRSAEELITPHHQPNDRRPLYAISRGA